MTKEQLCNYCKALNKCNTHLILKYMKSNQMPQNPLDIIVSYFFRKARFEYSNNNIDSCIAKYELPYLHILEHLQGHGFKLSYNHIDDFDLVYNKIYYILIND